MDFGEFLFHDVRCISLLFLAVRGNLRLWATWPPPGCIGGGGMGFSSSAREQGEQRPSLLGERLLPRPDPHLACAARFDQTIRKAASVSRGSTSGHPRMPR